MKENLIKHKIFEIGDLVKIIPGTRFYKGGPTEKNPKDVVGIIDRDDGEWFRVTWDNDHVNNYEAQDLDFWEAKEIPIVDSNKIYLPKTPKDLYDLLEILYPRNTNRKAIETYYKDSKGNMIKQCIANKMRSFDDIWIIANTYFPDIDVREVFKAVLLFNTSLEEVEKGIIYKSLANCSTMRRIRYTNSISVMRQVWNNIDCAKYDSIYKWRDLFNMIYINSLEQWIEWYKRELTK